MPAPSPSHTPTSLAARIGRFVVSGGSAAVVNLVVLHLLVARLGLNGGFREDGANLLALEASALFQFAVCRRWVWPEATRRSLRQALIAFHATIAATATGRVLLYMLLRQWGVHHLVNATLGIGLVAAANYLLYDRLVFTVRQGARAGERRPHDRSQGLPG